MWYCICECALPGKKNRLNKWIIVSLSLLVGEINSGEIALVMNIPVVSHSSVRLVHAVLRQENRLLLHILCVNLSAGAKSNSIQFTFILLKNTRISLADVSSKDTICPFCLNDDSWQSWTNRIPFCHLYYLNISYNIDCFMCLFH